jgi:hypothetical protein
MRLNERLNFVIPLYRGDDDCYAWVHAAPISREVFESNYLLLSKTFTAIHSEGLGEIAGPKIARLLMNDVAKSMDSGSPDALTRPLMNEMRRLTNVLLRTNLAWETMPLQDAISHKALDDDDLSEVENILTFFTVVLHLYPKNMRQTYLDGASRMWGAQMLSSNSTEFLSSLPTSTEIASTGGKQVAVTPASSVPS